MRGGALVALGALSRRAPGPHRPPAVAVIAGPPRPVAHPLPSRGTGSGWGAVVPDGPAAHHLRQFAVDGELRGWPRPSSVDEPSQPARAGLACEPATEVPSPPIAPPPRPRHPRRPRRPDAPAGRPSRSTGPSPGDLACSVARRGASRPRRALPAREGAGASRSGSSHRRRREPSSVRCPGLPPARGRRTASATGFPRGRDHARPAHRRRARRRPRRARRRVRRSPWRTRAWRRCQSTAAHAAPPTTWSAVAVFSDHREGRRGGNRGRHDHTGALRIPMQRAASERHAV